MALPKIIAVVGPTASGKSDLTVFLAKKFRGEIVSADSRQVYRGMDIGTGKVTKKEMQGIPHHLLDILDPSEDFSAAEYQKLAFRAIRAILRRKKLPILVGGTGFYIQAVVDNFQFPEVAPNQALRAKLEQKTTEELFGILKLFDPGRAKTIDTRNRRRLIRALEIRMTTKQPSLPLQQRTRIFDTLLIGISPDKDELRSRITKRLRLRLAKGMIDEVYTLHQKGISYERLERFGLEYRYIAQYLQKKLSKKEMEAGLARAIKQYARRQMTWFRRDKRIHWIQNSKDAKTLTREFLRKK